MTSPPDPPGAPALPAIQDLLDGFAHGAVLFDREERLVAFNRAYERMNPEICAELRRGMPFRDCLAVAARVAGRMTSPAEIEAWIAQRLQGRSADGGVAELRTSAGLIAVVQERRLPDGAFMLTYLDVTEERRLEQELRRSRDDARRLALVAEYTDNAVIITDAKGIIEWVNPGFTRLTGYSLAESVGSSPGMILTGPDADRETLARMRTAIAAGEGFDVEILNYTKLREPFWAAVECVPVHDSDGVLQHFIAIESDITQRRAQQDALEAALRQARDAMEHQRNFVSVAAHEFRTPLAIIDSSAQRLLARDDGQRVDDRARLDRIRNAVGRMTQLIDATLNSERLEQGRLEFDPVPCDLAELVRAVVRRLEVIAQDFRLAMTGAASGLPVVGDPRLLDQVFTNLVSNAIKFSGASREVVIDFGVDAGQARIRILDRGIGIPAAELDRLFTRFFRASTAKGIAGTGIGLHLVRELVAMHQGTIAVTSQPGQGTCFEVRLPLAPALASRQS